MESVVEQIFIDYYKLTRLIPYKRVYSPLKQYITYSAKDRCKEYPFLDHVCLSHYWFLKPEGYGPRPCKVFIRKQHPAEKFIQKHHSLYSRFKYLYRRKLNTNNLPYPIIKEDIPELLMDGEFDFHKGYQELQPIGDDYNLYTHFVHM